MQHQIKQLLISVGLILGVKSGFAQHRHTTGAKLKPVFVSSQLKAFVAEATKADVNFIFPKGYREINATDDEDFSFNYALALPGADFEAWFRVKSEKQNWISYTRNSNIPGRQLTNPDSVYASDGTADAIAFTGSSKYYFTRSMPRDMLDRYHADAGKSYLLTLLDLPATRHYKYALMITLQKFHKGSITEVYFTNNKDPEFFKNVEQAGRSLTFNP